MPAKSSRAKVPAKEVPQALVIAGIVVLVLILAAGGFYAYNGGWKTAGQKDEAFKHEMLPIIAAKHGDKELLDQENKARQQRGQSPLEMPRDKKESPKDFSKKLSELQQKLRGSQGQ